MNPPRPLRIGPLQLDLPAVQAALSGYSDLPMRRVARAHGAPFCVNEVVLDEAVLTRGRLQRRILDVRPDDHPVAGQLMGAVPETFGRAARELVRAGYDVVDVNFGCPVPKVLGRCRGGYLLGDPGTALDIVERVVDACAGDVPVMVKMRRGIDDSPEAERAFFTILEGAFERGVAAVTLHPRTVAQRYTGRADRAWLARVKRHVGDRVVLGSGDLFGPEDVAATFAVTRVDGVTLARGAIGNPWLFEQVAAVLRGARPTPPTIGRQRAAIEMHLRECLTVHGPDRGVGRTRQHAIKYAAVHPEPLAVRDAFVAARTAADCRAVLDRHYPPERAAEISEPLLAARLRAQDLTGCGADRTAGSP